MPTDPSRLLRNLADWCDRHGVTDIVSATVLYDGCARVHVELDTLRRLAPDAPVTRDWQEYGHEDGIQHRHLDVVVDGVTVAAVERRRVVVEAAPTGGAA